MAKGSGNRGDGRSKIRFIMLEADLGEGDLDQVTQAIANALRPSAPVVQRLVSSGPPVASRPTDVEDAEILEEEGDDVQVVSAPRSKEKGSSGPRQYGSPKVLEDVDLESSVSFADFAAERNPVSVADKYLTVAAWFKLHRNTDAISMHHVYTCFLHPRVKWSTKIDDFGGMLRYHKKRNRMTSPSRGLYAINHIGLAEVNMYGSGKATE